MQTPQNLTPDVTNSYDQNRLAGWDIGLTACALACMTAGFWRLWPGALLLPDAPVGPMILKAGLASLGFVALASRWEDAARALSRNPLALVVMALVTSSAIWAIVPAEALRHAIMLIVIWVFGIALALRFKPRELSQICASAGILGLSAQFVGHQTLPPVSAFDGDVAFAIIGNAWAAWCVPTRRLFWLMALGACCALAVAVGDFASLGAIAGLVVGCAVAQLSAIRSRHGSVSIMVTAWVLVALIIGVTLFALFGVDPVTAKLASFFEGLGPHMIIGQGFGVSGQSVASALGAGLGVVGVMLAGLVVFATVFQVLLSNRQIGSESDGTIAIWFASLGAILVDPSNVTIFGPVIVVFAASSFTISLSCLTTPRRRQSLRQSVMPQRLVQLPPTPPRNTTPPTSDSPHLTAMGLRPKR